MMFLEKPCQHFKGRNNVGGMDTLPSTSRLRAADIAAYATAYVETLKRPGNVIFKPIRYPGQNTSKLLKIPAY